MTGASGGGLRGGHGLVSIARAARRAELRIRLRRALHAGTTQTAIALTATAAILSAEKLGAFGAASLRGRDFLIGAIVSVPLAATFALLRRLPRVAGSLALDRYHGLEDRLTTALELARWPSDKRTPLVQMAIADAEARAATLSPRRSVRFGWPRDLPAAAVLAAGVALLSFLHVSAVRPRPIVRPIEPVALDADDIDLFREAAAQLDREVKDPALKERIEQFNRLVEDLAHRRLERTEAFRRIDDLASRLLDGRAMDSKELGDQLMRRARALQTSELTRPAAEALAQQNLADAEKRLRELSQRLRRPRSVDKEALARMREAMQKAAAGQKQRIAELERRRDEMRERLLRQERSQPDAGPRDEEEQRLLRDQKRELERLERDLDDEKRAERQLDRLDRDIDQAAQDIMRQLGASADDLDRGAEDIHRLADQQMSEQEREQLRQRLEDLREQLRQQGAGGVLRRVRIARFVRDARGQRGQQGSGGGTKQGAENDCPPGQSGCENGRRPGGEGQSGQGQNGQGQGSQGQGQNQGQGQGQGQNGEGQQGNGSGSGEPTVVVDPNAPNGNMLLILPGQGRSGSGAGSEQGSGERNGEGSRGSGQGPTGPRGNAAGAGHDPKLTGKPTDGRMQTTEDVQAAAVDTGHGATRSEVILGAAEKGFGGGAYRRVYTEYHTVAEQALHKDEVPPGESQHVRRYFDLIRPRQ